ncbi:hypothetical protein PanWU01x14_002410 [Parasponia andersonii]|uniref:Transmembrane protein n=1 Tax=Parasponia andersonii TaxID=3476 RepID=A0A2P5E552_PARAD|nr:hypothetical protein PanWU01x14_002410 [Parasponia andersonii]
MAWIFLDEGVVNGSVLGFWIVWPWLFGIASPRSFVDKSPKLFTNPSSSLLSPTLLNLKNLSLCLSNLSLRLEKSSSSSFSHLQLT